VFALLMMIFSIICFPCTFCCCCRKSKRDVSEIKDIGTIVALLCLIGGCIAFGFGLSGATNTTGVLTDAEDSLGMITGTVDELTGLVADLTRNLKIANTTLTAYKGCALTDGLLAVTGMEVPPLDLSLDFSKIKADITYAKSLQSTWSILLGLVGFVFSTYFSLMSFQRKLPACKHLAGIRKLLSCVFVPFSMVCLILYFLGAIPLKIAGVFFADFCAVDPIVRITDLALPLTGDEEMASMVSFFVSCQGVPPQRIMEVLALTGKLAQAQSNIAGLGVLAQKGGGVCSTVDVDKLGADMGAAISTVTLLVEYVSCSTMNPIAVKLFHDMICTNLQAALSKTAAGLIMTGCFLIIGMYNYKRSTAEHTDGKVHPKLKSLVSDEPEPDNSPQGAENAGLVAGYA